MKILITGAAGFIGTHLTRFLLATTDHEIVGVDNCSTHTFAESLIGHPNFLAIPADIRDADTLSAAMRECALVFHLAAISSVQAAQANPQHALDVNVFGTYSVLEAAKRANVERLVFASSREVYGEREQHIPTKEDCRLRPLNVYGRSKLAAETLCQVAYPLIDVVTARLTNVFGAGDRGRLLPLWLDACRKHQPLMLYGDKFLDFVRVETVVYALWQLGQYRLGDLDHYGVERINVGSGVGTSLLTIARWLEKQTGCEILFKPYRGYEVQNFVADVSQLENSLPISQRTEKNAVFDFLREQLESVPV